MDTIRLEVRGQTYLWNGDTWTDDRFMRPPSNVRGQLTTLLVKKLRRTPLKKLDLELSMRVARACVDDVNLDDAGKMAKRVLKADPDHVEAATLLAEILRKQRLPRRAIKVTEPFVRRHDAAMLTVRAAAFCDISDWDEAEKLVRRALTIEKADASPETLQVMTRVISARTREAA